MASAGLALGVTSARRLPEEEEHPLGILDCPILPLFQSEMAGQMRATLYENTLVQSIPIRTDLEIFKL